MNTISTIGDTTWQTRASGNGALSVCWCGQDLEYVRSSHCPRCGSAHAGRVESRPTRLAG